MYFGLRLTGTGKSTLVRYIIQSLPYVRPETDVKYVAYTGKASNVLKKLGYPGATTAHKLLYHAVMLSNGKYHFTPRTELEGHPLVIVVDEISMLPKKMWELLCKHNVYIIACGDPEQLPPVQDEKGEDTNNHVLDNPHIFLDEIMRQAQESEIVRFSMHIREGKSIHTYHPENKEVMFIKKEDYNESVLMWGNQILCATNRMTDILNNDMRKAQGFSGDLQIGDKIINRHNEWDFMSNLETPFTNGIIGTVTNFVQKENQKYPGFIRKQVRPIEIATYKCDMIGDDDNEIFADVIMDYNFINGQAEALNGHEKYLLHKLKIDIPFTITYGYAITVWKAQGSQWDKIVLFDETWPTDKDLHRRYLYTGITRAINKLVVII